MNVNLSTTLDRYLKHRFNGDVANKMSNDADNGRSLPSSQDDTTTNASNKTFQPIEVHNISFQKLMPCCVALRDDCSYIAAGFENSHIYLWDLSIDDSHQEKSHQNATQTPATTTTTPAAATTTTTTASTTTVTATTTATTIVTTTAATLASKSATAPNDTVVLKTKTPLKSGTKHRLLAHSGPIYHIEFVANNDLMLSCSEDTTIRLWCLNEKSNLTVYRGHSYPVWSIAVAPRGDSFVSASMDTTARLWRFDKMCPVRIFCGHDDDVECIKFHPNTKYIATGSSDSTVRLWSISDGKMVRLMVGHKSSIISLSFLPDGKFLASASNDGAIKIWNLATNNVVSDLSVPTPLPATTYTTTTSTSSGIGSCSSSNSASSTIAPALLTISFSPEQSFVASCGCDNILRVWQFLGKLDIVERRKYDFREQFSKIVQTLFHRNNKLFIIGYKASE